MNLCIFMSRLPFNKDFTFLKSNTKPPANKWVNYALDFLTINTFYRFYKDSGQSIHPHSLIWLL